jgi:hypothetical protein
MENQISVSFINTCYVRYLKSVFLALFFVISSSTHAQLIEPILGIKLGELAVGQFDECPRQRDKWCTERMRPKKQDDWWVLYAPHRDSPSALPTWVKSQEELMIKPNAEGIVDHFTVTTRGPRVQDSVISVVTGRFGEPNNLSKRTGQTATGVQVESIYAFWETPDIVVTHICSYIDECRLSFYTKEAYKRVLEKIEKNEKRDKKL